MLHDAPFCAPVRRPPRSYTNPVVYGGRRSGVRAARRKTRRCAKWPQAPSPCLAAVRRSRRRLCRRPAQSLRGLLPCRFCRRVALRAGTGCGFGHATTARRSAEDREQTPIEREPRPTPRLRRRSRASASGRRPDTPFAPTLLPEDPIVVEVDRGGRLKPGVWFGRPLFALTAPPPEASTRLKGFGAIAGGAARVGSCARPQGIKGCGGG